MRSSIFIGRGSWCELDRYVGVFCVCGSGGAHTHTSNYGANRRFKFRRPHQPTHTHHQSKTTVQITTDAPSYPHTLGFNHDARTKRPTHTQIHSNNDGRRWGQAMSLLTTALSSSLSPDSEEHRKSQISNDRHSVLAS
jgi:hypothetical protein